jgi:hypothetical protein
MMIKADRKQFQVGYVIKARTTRIKIKLANLADIDKF